MTSLSSGIRVFDLASSNTVIWNRAEVFTKEVSVNTTFQFIDVKDKHIKISITNTTGSDITVDFTATQTIKNASNIITRLRANKTQVYEFVGDIRNDFIYCLHPIKDEATLTS